MVGEKDIKLHLFFKIILCIAITMMVINCEIYPPTSEERLDVLSGKKSLVLIRITCELNDGTPVKAFPLYRADWLLIGKGSPKLGSNVKWMAQYGGSRFLRCFSHETLEQGWVFFYLEPGKHYLGFVGTEEMLRLYVPRFEVNIPINSPVVYLGTLHFPCLWTLSDVNGCGSIDQNRVLILNEEIKAKKLVEDNLLGLGSLQTLLIKPL